MTHELLVVGGSLAGLSAASRARRAGVDDVVVVAVGDPGISVELAETDHISVESVESIDRLQAADGIIELRAGEQSFTARNVIIDLVAVATRSEVPWPIPDQVAHRFHSSIDFDTEDKDVLVVGKGESAVMIASELVQTRARIVLAFEGDTSGISMLGQHVLEKLEREQMATILWRSWPDTIWSVGDFPMVTFGDRRTPDLQFDHVVVAMPPDSPALPFEVDFDDDGAEGLFVITESGSHSGPGTTLTPALAWNEIQKRRFPGSVIPSHYPVIDMDAGRVRQLAASHYNATITLFDTAHNELWRIRLRPDREAIAHQAGQYCSIGLGYWEPRADEAVDEGLESKRDKLIRRSYSISSPILDGRGYLADPAASGEIELYIVWVQPDGDRVPALTPRLALKNVGDRLYLGPKVAGRYTIERVTDPSCSVVFVATGTGEAPHNAMLVELLRKGHHGPILSVVSVRYLSDLAYQREHLELEERYPNYKYLAVPTREAGHPKRYAQDLLEDGAIEEALGASLDPGSTHVYLCGNPGMIGLPEFENEKPVFPATVGMAQLLHERGFTIDRRKRPGNLHYEEYW
ncbi:MAG TPA: NAD(P)-binding domain-containing protein [Acidimicrobiia bacterium]|nr:NAD(P)-binding domain-containing protein [Acidimicrobiia bacterium]